jgi:hypothetical protein
MGNVLDMVPSSIVSSSAGAECGDIKKQTCKIYILFVLWRLYIWND